MPAPDPVPPVTVPSVTVPPIPIGLSTSSVFPDACPVAFDLAERLGYDGVEVMVWTDLLTQDVDALRALSGLHAMPVLSVHAPTLLLTQGVWGPDSWVKVDNSVRLALELGARTVVLHPPFRWQVVYASGFADGVAERAASSGLRLAVENMFPWRAGSRRVQGYLPDWDPVGQPYEHVTLDLSHTATSGSDAVAMAAALGDRLAHLHLADGLGSPQDEHLVPGRGTQPCAAVLRSLTARGFDGSVVVEVNTRRRTASEREADLAESLAFARRALAAPA